MSTPQEEASVSSEGCFRVGFWSLAYEVPGACKLDGSPTPLAKPQTLIKLHIKSTSQPPSLPGSHCHTPRGTDKGDYSL